MRCWLYCFLYSDKVKKHDNNKKKKILRKNSSEALTIAIKLASTSQVQLDLDIDHVDFPTSSST